MSDNYFQPWISDEEPKVPEGWGLDTFRGRMFEMKCQHCNEYLKFREQYLYKYTKEGTKILHNTQECTVDGWLVDK